MTTPELAVIICTRNGAESIGGALDSLAAQVTTLDWELVISDNGSTDGTAGVVRSHPQLGDQALIVDSSDRKGLSHARNVGVDATTAKYVAFLDDDDEVATDWLDELVCQLRKHRFVGSSMEYEKLNESRQMEGRAQFQRDALQSIFGFTVVNGAGAGIERALWQLVGGNDESLTTTGEDFDFSIRVQDATSVVPVLAKRASYHYRQRDGFVPSFQQGRRYGIGHVMLFARYGQSSPSREDLRRVRHLWWWVVTRAPVRIFSSRRSTWARQLGIRVGRLQGSLIEHRWCP